MVFSLTDETRKHRIEEFERMLPLVKATLDTWKELLKQRRRINSYEKHKKGLEKIIKEVKKLSCNDVAKSFYKEKIQEVMESLKENLKRTEEFIQVLEEENAKLENIVEYYRNYFVCIGEAICTDEEPILDEDNTDITYIREYLYLICLVRNTFSKKSILSQEAINKIDSYVIDNLELKEGSKGSIIIDCLVKDKRIDSVVKLFEIFN